MFSSLFFIPLKFKSHRVTSISSAIVQWHPTDELASPDVYLSESTPNITAVHENARQFAFSFANSLDIQIKILAAFGWLDFLIMAGF